MTLAADAVIHDFGPALARVAASYERNRALREELLQDIFLAIVTALPRLRDRAKLKPIIARRDSLRWDDETPAGVLRAGLRRAEASMRAIRVGRWHVVVITLFVAILWITEAAGLIHARRFLVFYSAVCAVVVVPYAIWLRWRDTRVAAERAACRRLLDDLEANGRGLAPLDPASQATQE